MDKEKFRAAVASQNFVAGVCWGRSANFEKQEGDGDHERVCEVDTEGSKIRDLLGPQREGQQSGLACVAVRPLCLAARVEAYFASEGEGDSEAASEESGPAIEADR